MEEMAVDGILYGLYRILEEATNLNDGTKVMFPDVPWDSIRGMRNRLAYDYPGTRFDMVSDDIDKNWQPCRRCARDIAMTGGSTSMPLPNPMVPR